MPFINAASVGKEHGEFARERTGAGQAFPWHSLHAFLDVCVKLFSQASSLIQTSLLDSVHRPPSQTRLVATSTWKVAKHNTHRIPLDFAPFLLCDCCVVRVVKSLHHTVKSLHHTATHTHSRGVHHHPSLQQPVLSVPRLALPQERTTSSGLDRLPPPSLIRLVHRAINVVVSKATSVQQHGYAIVRLQEQHLLHRDQPASGLPPHASPLAVSACLRERGF